MGRKAVIEKISEVLGDGPTYMTIDIDGIDPAWAPGTGVPKSAASPREVQVMVRSLQGKHLVGGDICEVAPCFDPTGITAVTAATSCGKCSACWRIRRANISEVRHPGESRDRLERLKGSGFAGMTGENYRFFAFVMAATSRSNPNWTSLR